MGWGRKRNWGETRGLVWGCRRAPAARNLRPRSLVPRQAHPYYSLRACRVHSARLSFPTSFLRPLSPYPRPHRTRKAPGTRHSGSTARPLARTRTQIRPSPTDTRARRCIQARHPGSMVRRCRHGPPASASGWASAHACEHPAVRSQLYRLSAADCPPECASYVEAHGPLKHETGSRQA